MDSTNKVDWTELPLNSHQKRLCAMIRLGGNCQEHPEAANIRERSHHRFSSGLRVAELRGKDDT